MEKELKWIKKHYGEKMMHLCRELFPKILENEGVLSNILKSHFAQNRTLAEDIINQNMQDDFKNYIFSFIETEAKEEVKVSPKTATQLLKEAGYILYPECQTEEDIQSFKKYWAKGEELCTFRGGRLNSCRVWFAVKENVDDIKREDFKNPARQDEYGTSVISIQFSRGDGKTLSIKNRYNHTVINPDNTFNSDLDRIIPGLSDAFERDYGVRDKSIRNDFELDNYICINGKYYHYNSEINNIYYCDNNVIINDTFITQIITLPSHQMLIDYFIIDFKTKEIKLYDNGINDGFFQIIKNPKNIFKDGNKIIIEKKNQQIIEFEIDANRSIISIKDENLTKCGDHFLSRNKSLKEVDFPNLTKCGDFFLEKNANLLRLNLPKLKKCGEYFLFFNTKIEAIYLPKLVSCGNYFLFRNQNLTKLNLPNLTMCGDSFLCRNELLNEIFLPELTECGSEFLCYNTNLIEVDLSNLYMCGDYFLEQNEKLEKIILPNLLKCGNYFLYYNRALKQLNIPNLIKCGNDFLYFNKALEELHSPKLSKCGKGFLNANNKLRKLKPISQHRIN